MEYRDDSSTGTFELMKYCSWNRLALDYRIDDITSAPERGTRTSSCWPYLFLREQSLTVLDRDETACRNPIQCIHDKCFLFLYNCAPDLHLGPKASRSLFFVVFSGSTITHVYCCCSNTRCCTSEPLRRPFPLPRPLLGAGSEPSPKVKSFNADSSRLVYR